MTSAAPGTFSTKVAASLALSYNSCVSSPYSLMAISAFAPRHQLVEAKLYRLREVEFGTFRERSKCIFHFIHHFCTASGTCPFFEWFHDNHHISIFHCHRVSGNFRRSYFGYHVFDFRNLSINAFSAKRETSILSVSELPAGSVICMAKSPSSKVGMNSAPQAGKEKK